MIKLDVPASISRASVMDFVRSLGIEPDDAVSLTIDPSGVRLVVLAKNGEGRSYCHSSGETAQHIIAIDFTD